MSNTHNNPSPADEAASDPGGAAPDSFLTKLRRGLELVFFGYLFFLALGVLGAGMKESFRGVLADFLRDAGGEFSELSSFVTGIIGTALVQSSSSVTSMGVVLTQEGILPLVIAIGIAHGANLGTSVTSTIVAFAADFRHSSGNLFRRLRDLLLQPRGEGFRRACGTAVVHDMFNVLMVTLILIVLELPFGIIRGGAEASAGWLADSLSSGTDVSAVMKWLAPATYTKPITGSVLDLGVPGWALALSGLPLIFMALKGFSSRMRSVILRKANTADTEALGRRLLGDSAWSTFLRGLLITVLVQSSSATTSMVVPLAAMGLFRVRQIFPFIMGANIGTTTTAILAALGGVGEPGFHDGMTIALSHFYLNSLAVLLVVALPGLRTSILGAAQWLSWKAGRRPLALLMYVLTLSVFAPLGVFLLPETMSLILMGALVLGMIVGPHIHLRRRMFGRPARMLGVPLGSRERGQPVTPSTAPSAADPLGGMGLDAPA